MALNAVALGLLIGLATASAADPHDRVADLEKRLSQLEQRAQPQPQTQPQNQNQNQNQNQDADALPSVSGSGGVIVPAREFVRDAVGLGGPVDVAGTVRGTALGLGADVLVRPGGAVEGDAVSLGGDVLVEPGGTLNGRALALRPQDGAEAMLAVPGNDGWHSLVRSLGRRLAVLLAFMSAGTLALSVWPEQVDEISVRLSDRPFWYGMAGAALTAGLSVGAAFMAVTVIGLPVAILFLVVLGLAWLMGLVAVCRTASRRLGLTTRHSDAVAWLGGAALFSLLAMVPVFGTVIALLLGFPAVGAAVVAGLSRQSPIRRW